MAGSLTRWHAAAVALAAAARRVWALALNLLSPGLGHIYARAFRAGLIYLLLCQAIGLAIRGLTRATAPSPTTVALFVGAAALFILVYAAALIGTWRRMRDRSALPRPRWYRSTWFIGAIVLLATIPTERLLTAGWQTFSIPSGSMLPTLVVGDYMAVDSRTAGHLPARGDVIVFIHPRRAELDYVKRVIGLPGERVAVHGGMVEIDGVPLQRVAAPEQFATSQERISREILPDGRSHLIVEAKIPGSASDMAERTVPPGHVFVLGDARDNSVDSRYAELGPVPIENILGIAGTIYWSPDRSRILHQVE